MNAMKIITVTANKTLESSNTHCTTSTNNAICYTFAFVSFVS